MGKRIFFRSQDPKTSFQVSRKLEICLFYSLKLYVNMKLVPMIIKNIRRYKVYMSIISFKNA